MNWSAAHREAMFAAFEVHERLEIDTFDRVDVFDAMALDGIRLVFRPLVSAAGLYLPPGRGRPGAIVNSQHPLALQRYSAGHEYGHHVFRHGEQIDSSAEPSGTGVAAADDEKLAEAFAAWFLMPPEAAKAVCERLHVAKPSQPADAYALALRLGTSYTATCTHLPSLKLVHTTQANRWRDLSLKAIKQELSTTSPPGGWRSDVWVVSADDADIELTVRAGDRLLIDLPTHDIDSIPDGAAASLLPPPDLLATGRWCVDLPANAAPGPAAVSLRTSAETINFPLFIERPRLGLYIPRIGAPR